MFAPGVSDEDRDKKLFTKLGPRKLHDNGCLLSQAPEVCVSGVGRSTEGKRRESGCGLTKSLYFKWCDGSFRNLEGEVLDTHNDGEALQMKK